METTLLIMFGWVILLAAISSWLEYVHQQKRIGEGPETAFSYGYLGKRLWAFQADLINWVSIALFLVVLAIKFFTGSLDIPPPIPMAISWLVMAVCLLSGMFMLGIAGISLWLYHQYHPNKSKEKLSIFPEKKILVYQQGEFMREISFSQIVKIQVIKSLDRYSPLRYFAFVRLYLQSSDTLIISSFLHPTLEEFKKWLTEAACDEAAGFVNPIAG